MDSLIFIRLLLRKDFFVIMRFVRDTRPEYDDIIVIPHKKFSTSTLGVLVQVGLLSHVKRTERYSLENIGRELLALADKWKEEEIHLLSRKSVHRFLWAVSMGKIDADDAWMLFDSQQKKLLQSLYSTSKKELSEKGKILRSQLENLHQFVKKNSTKLYSQPKISRFPDSGRELRLFLVLQQIWKNRNAAMDRGKLESMEEVEYKSGRINRLVTELHIPKNTFLRQMKQLALEGLIELKKWNHYEQYVVVREQMMTFLPPNEYINSDDTLS